MISYTLLSLSAFSLLLEQNNELVVNQGFSMESLFRGLLGMFIQSDNGRGEFDINWGDFIFDFKSSILFWTFFGIS